MADLLELASRRDLHQVITLRAAAFDHVSPGGLLGGGRDLAGCSFTSMPLAEALVGLVVDSGLGLGKQHL